eukprot:4771124-Prymnesium_polylepis.1
MHASSITASSVITASGSSCPATRPHTTKCDATHSTVSCFSAAALAASKEGVRVSGGGMSAEPDVVAERGCVSPSLADRSFRKGWSSMAQI